MFTICLEVSGFDIQLHIYYIERRLTYLNSEPVYIRFVYCVIFFSIKGDIDSDFYFRIQQKSGDSCFMCVLEYALLELLFLDAWQVEKFKNGPKMKLKLILKNRKILIKMKIQNFKVKTVHNASKVFIQNNVVWNIGFTVPYWKQIWIFGWRPRLNIVWQSMTGCFTGPQ